MNNMRGDKMWTLLDQPPAGDVGWKHLAEAVVNARTRLKLDQRDLTLRSGPSATWIRQLELGRGKPSRVSTIAKLERALAWEPGSVVAVWNGGAPVPTAAAEPWEPVHVPTDMDVHYPPVNVIALDQQLVTAWLTYCEQSGTTPSDSLAGWLARAHATT